MFAFSIFLLSASASILKQKKAQATNACVMYMRHMRGRERMDGRANKHSLLVHVCDSREEGGVTN